MVWDHDLYSYLSPFPKNASHKILFMISSKVLLTQKYLLRNIKYYHQHVLRIERKKERRERKSKRESVIEKSETVKNLMHRLK